MIVLPSSTSCVIYVFVAFCVGDIRRIYTREQFTTISTSVGRSNTAVCVDMEYMPTHSNVLLRFRDMSMHIRPQGEG